MSLKDIPPSHPRFQSLLMRDRITEGVKKSIVAESGAIAHGRGEAFDYLLGEKTHDFAIKAIEAAAALILESQLPILSINGNLAALCPEDIKKLQNSSPLKMEVNLFYRSRKREKAIAKQLKTWGVHSVLGLKKRDCVTLSSIDHARRIVDRNGIALADTVLIPLEDGDRAQALVKEGKKTIVVDLNPLSRTAQSGTITIVDNIVRVMPLLVEKLNSIKNISSEARKKIINSFDNQTILKEAEETIRRTPCH